MTGSFVVVGIYLSAKHHWLSGGLSWLGASPKSQPPKNLTPPKGPLNDWEAAIIAYTILLMVGATDAAPVAQMLAVGLALGTGISTINILGTEYPQTFGSGSSGATNVSSASSVTTSSGGQPNFAGPT